MQKRPGRRRYRRTRFDFDSIRWPAVFLAAGVLIVLVVGGIFLVRALLPGEKPGPAPTFALDATPEGSAAPTQVATLPPAQGTGIGTFENPIDLSLRIKKIVSKEENVNTPDIYKNEMVYSAGTGSLLKPLLKTLYLYDFELDEEIKMADVQIKDGEIFETVVNDDYIVWLDTDQQGSNAIYCLYRDQPNSAPVMIKNCSFAVPKIRLSGDYLIWIEQIEPGEERLFVLDLISQENASIPGFIESVEEAMATYGVSAPSIYGTQVVWAATDPEQSAEERILQGERSAIYSCDLSRFVEDDYAPSVFSPGMYVHDPITNGQVWAWIDKNKAPDSNLYLKLGDEVIQVAQNVISYALGDEMLVFAKDGNIYVYFYLTGQFGRANEEGSAGILPVVSGRRIVWFDKGTSGKDQLVYVAVPYDVAE